MSKKAVGTLLVCISGTAFGTYAYFALMADHAGIGPISLLFYRFTIAAAILAGGALLTKARLPTRGQIPGLIVLGGLYVGQSFTFLQCLRTSNPITASLLLYLYPVFVTIGSSLFLHEKLTAAKTIALVCALAGSFLIIGPASGVTPVSIAYGIGTALFYATYLVSGKWFLRRVEPLFATLTIIVTAATVYGIGSAVTGLQTSHTPVGWVGVACLGVVATVIAIGCLLWGLEYVSPVEASTLSALEPLVTAVLAVTLLGQSLQSSQVLGGVLVIAAVVVLARQAAVVRSER